jgi:predicted metal-dependent hydrolase
MPGVVLVFEDDVLFSSRVENGLRANGYRARFVTRIEGLGEALKAAPVLVLVSTGSIGVPWRRLVELVKERRPTPRPSVVSYGPHVDLDLRQQALEAGCDAVVARSAIANSLPSLLERYAWRPELSACDESLPAGVQKGIDQFNSRAFYRCHDSIELVWVDEPRDVRLMYQGLLQIAVAFYHVRKGNWRGMVKMMARGKGKLLPFLPSCQGIDLDGLLADLEACETTLRDNGPEMTAEFDQFPTIHLDG